jgi:mannose-1-phosphate guanylyltransferase
MLLVWLERLAEAGVGTVVVNAFHLAGHVKAFLDGIRGDFPGMEIALSLETSRLGTGGGLRQARGLLSGGPVYVVNSDIFGDVPLEAMAEAHALSPGILATLAAVDRGGQGTVGASGDGRIVSLREPAPSPGEDARLCGAGAMVLSPGALAALPDGPSDVIAELRSMMAQGGEARVVRLPSDAYWCDMGTPGDYHSLNRRLARGGRFAEGCRVEGEVSGFLAAEPGSWIKEGARVRDSILWADAVVEEGCSLSGMIVAGRARAGTRMSGGVITGD